MLRTRVMPCLLLRGRGLVKSVRFKDPKYVGDPINTVRIFNEKGVDELVVLDIKASKEGREPNYAMIEDIVSECFMPIAYGGGVRTIESMKRIFSVGVEKIVLNDVTLKDLEFLSRASKVFGKQSIVASIDIKKNLWGKYKVYSHSTKKLHKLGPVEMAQRVTAHGAGEILLNSVDLDGTFEGYDTDLIKLVSHEVDVPVIACGGAGCVEDFGKAVHDGGASAVAAGSLVVYQGVNRAVLINFPTEAEIEAVL